MATQLHTHQLGRPLPALPGEPRTPNVPAVPTAVQSRHRHQAPEACRLVLVTRYTAVCAVHGRFAIDEYESSPRCPGGDRRHA